MAGELLSVLGIQPAKAPAAPSGDPDLDAIIRTVYGEASNQKPEGRRAVAAVILNRARMAGKTPAEIVMEDGQFEPWGDKEARARMEALTPQSKDYLAIQSDIADVLNGQDPTGGATHFYAPKAQADLGRAKPAWDDGTGVDIGDHRFFKGEYAQSKAPGLLDILGIAPTAAAADRNGGTMRVGPDGAIEINIDRSTNPEFLAAQEARRAAQDVPAPEDGGNLLTDALKKTVGVAQRGAEIYGLLNPSMNPLLTPLINQDRQDAARQGLMSGGAFGGKNEIISAAGAIPAMVGGGWGAGVDQFDQNLQELDARDADLVDRFPVTMNGARAVGALAPNVLAPVIGATTMLGRAGVGALTGGLSGLAGGYLGTDGTEQDRERGALTSGVIGTLTGGLIGGVAGRGGSAAEKLSKDAAPVIEQAKTVMGANGLRVPIPMTIGEITASPSQQLAENALLKGVKGEKAAKVMQAFKAEQQGAIAENAVLMKQDMAGQPLSVGEGGQLVSERLNAMRDAAKKGVDTAYDAARAAGGDAMLESAKGTREAMINAVQDYDLEGIPRVAKEIEKFGEGGAPTVRQLLDARQRLSVLRQSNDPIEGGAASKAIKGLDGYVSDALQNDLFIGDPKAVQAWKDALKSRRDFGKLFDGGDIIEGLTERAQRSGNMTTKIDPVDAADYIFTRTDLGFVGKRDLTRDLTRMKEVLGPESPEWNALRGELFGRFVRAGRGPNEAGATTFSGQNFMNAWEKAKARDPEVLKAMFTAAERKQIDDFASIAQRVTTPVKGGDNYSNTAFTQMVMKGMNNIGTMLGGAAGSVAGPKGAAGGAAAGRALDEFLGSVRGVAEARRAIRGVAKPIPKGAAKEDVVRLLQGQPGAVNSAGLPLLAGRGAGAASNAYQGKPQ